MAPAEDNNWLSFSLSSMEMLVSSAPSPPIPLYHHQPSPPASSSQHFLLDHLYANEWINPRAAETAGGMYESAAERGGLGMITGFLDSQQQSVPKLEDFFGGETTSSLNTQDSSTLSNIYDPNPAYFNDISLPPPPVTGGGFQAFSANSGSEVDDSQIACAEFVGQPIESNGGGLSSQFASGAGTLSLAVPQSAGGSEKAVVTVRAESDNSKKIGDTFGQRTSIYRGVTRHRWTGRYEAHLWDNSCRREGQARKGRQVYLGGYDKEDKAARAYDLAALKYWGTSATTNFTMSSYSKEIEDMKPLTKQEFIASLRRKSSGFSRGASMYRGVTRHHQQGRWQARIGRVAGNKDLYLGTFATEEEAAEAYDIAAIKFRGMNAVTNFEMNRYDVEAILRSALPVGGTTAKRMKVEAEAEAEQQQQQQQLQHHHQPPEEQQAPPQGGPTNTTTINFAQQPAPALPYALPLDAASSYYQQGYFQSATALPLEWPTEFYLWPQLQPY